jgi:hypothetical protein
MTRRQKASQDFIAAQMEIRHGRATIATCGYKARTQAEQRSLESCERAAKKRQHRLDALLQAAPKPQLTLRQLVAKACKHPAGRMPIGYRGFPPSGAMVNRAIRRGYATLTRQRDTLGRNHVTYLVPTDKGRLFAQR